MSGADEQEKPAQAPGGRMAMDPTWVTRDGRRLKVSEMSDDHVAKARNFALRRAVQLDRLALSAYRYAADAPDGASMAAESEADEMANQAGVLRLWADHFSRVLKMRDDRKGGDDVR